MKIQNCWQTWYASFIVYHQKKETSLWKYVKSKLEIFWKIHHGAVIRCQITMGCPVVPVHRYHIRIYAYIICVCILFQWKKMKGWLCPGIGPNKVPVPRRFGSFCFSSSLSTYIPPPLYLIILLDSVWYSISFNLTKYLL